MKRILSFVLVICLALTAYSGFAFAEETEALTSESIKSAVPQIKAAYNGLTSIKVTYDELDGADGYCIYRATSKKGKYTKIATVDAKPESEKSTYVNTKRTTGKTYYYKLRAYIKADGKTYYSKYSEVASAYARPLKTKNVKSNYEYFAWGFKTTWDKQPNVTGYQLNYRKIGNTTWKTYQLYNGVKYYPRINKYSAGKSSYVTKNTCYWRLDDSNNKGYEIRVRAYKTVNGKKVYGLYSDPVQIKPLTAKEIQKIATDYVYKKYPNYNYYDNYGDNEPLTPENGSWGVHWYEYMIQQYHTKEYLEKILCKSIDDYFESMYGYDSEWDGKTVDGYLYVTADKPDEFGYYQVYWLM